MACQNKCKKCCNCCCTCNSLNSVSQTQNVIAPSAMDIDYLTKCVPGQLLYQTVKTTNLYYSATSNVVNATVASGVVLVPSGSSSNGRIFVTTTDNSKGGYVNLSEVKAITCG